MGVARAREFVLRDKRKTIQVEVDRICRPYWDAPDGTDGAVLSGAIKAALEAAYEITVYLDADEFEEQLCGAMEPSGFEAVGTLVAKKLLDHAPPPTKPPWQEPWGRGFGCLDLEQGREQVALGRRP
ncbi:hypothetical protein ASG60_20605 [Methylobacterium sp. Leaf469]|uniref:hypothetical protein n=1 Tax=Methylobacterium sp. Leaf469 TaxID=1736387 RepID=UPI0006F9CC79|nr:hypothetical protein [Methylobacterium sp. Leaf469]KQT96084.1 hypothetical protein ASG60_20605 [Methylobacterium sp. Leaf469]